MHVVHYCPHSGGAMYEWHYTHFITELEQNGHTVTDCNPVHTLGRQGSKGENSQILVDTIKTKLRKKVGPLMLFTASGNDANLEPSALEYIRQLGVPSVNMAIDGHAERLKQAKIAKHYDLVWGMHLNNMALSEYGANVVYLPMAANPNFFQPTGVQRQQQLAFVASRHGARGKYISALAAAGVPMVIRGARWNQSVSSNAEGMMQGKDLLDHSTRKALVGYAKFPEGRKILLGGIKRRLLHFLGQSKNYHSLVGDYLDVSDSVSWSEMVGIYSSSSLSLGVLEYWGTHVLRHPIYQYRLRDFECPMMGCAHITYRVPELENSFQEDKEMIFYTSLEECVDKVTYYLRPDNYDLCLHIGEQARKRSVAEHTWTNRFEKIWHIIGIS